MAKITGSGAIIWSGDADRQEQNIRVKCIVDWRHFPLLPHPHCSPRLLLCYKRNSDISTIHSTLCWLWHFYVKPCSTSEKCQYSVMFLFRTNKLYNNFKTMFNIWTVLFHKTPYCLAAKLPVTTKQATRKATNQPNNDQQCNQQSQQPK